MPRAYFPPGSTLQKLVIVVCTPTSTPAITAPVNVHGHPLLCGEVLPLSSHAVESVDDEVGHVAVGAAAPGAESVLDGLEIAGGETVEGGGEVGETTLR